MTDPDLPSIELVSDIADLYVDLMNYAADRDLSHIEFLAIILGRMTATSILLDEVDAFKQILGHAIKGIDFIASEPGPNVH